MNAHVTLPLFHVAWQGEVAAPSALAAAGQALVIIQDGAHFFVTPHGEDEPVEIDLARDVTSLRSLRPGLTYQTRTGLPAEILSWDEGGEFPLYVRIQNGDGDPITGCRTKSGLHPASTGNHTLDIVEVNPVTRKWVKIYDRKLNEAGKQVVGGKEFAAERGLFMYIYDTEEEAKANLRGARACFPIEYRDGEGLG